MKKIFTIFGIILFAGIINISDANAYKLLSSKELGKADAKNQNVVVKCTTDAGKLSNQICKFRRYAKCTGPSSMRKCNAWQQWKDMQKPSNEYPSWRAGAAACCQAKGLR